ncbi:MAG: hypothetical protein ACOH2V_00995 [Candidatus Saccharimonadaceae bacterium]
MGTRLNSLIEVMSTSNEDTGFDTDLKNETILKYFSTPNLICFLVGDVEMKVLTAEEVKERRYEIAKDIFNDKQNILSTFASSRYDEILEDLVRSLDSEECIKDIAFNVDFTEETGYILLGTSGEFYVYLLL